MFKNIIAFLLILVVFAGCLKSKETGGRTCTFDTCAVKAPASEVQVVESYLASKNITGAVKHCSGVYYIISEQGSGAKLTPCSFIVASYKGELADGRVFDQGQFQQYYPLTGLIKGWTNTIPLINVGGKIRLFIPSSLGYGSNQAGSIPPNSMLIFDVEVIAGQ